MRAIISVVGKDRPGILAIVSKECAQNNVNIIDVSQKVLENMFTMIMVVETDSNTEEFNKFVKDMDDIGNKNTLKIHVMHEDIFNAMHTI